MSLLDNIEVIETEDNFSDEAIELLEKIRTSSMERDTLKAEAKVLTEQAKEFDAVVLESRERLIELMQNNSTTQEKVDGALLTLKVSAPALDIADEDAVPDEYCSFDRKVNKTKIKQAIKDGAKLNFAVMAEGKTSLTINDNKG